MPVDVLFLISESVFFRSSPTARVAVINLIVCPKPKTLSPKALKHSYAALGVDGLESNRISKIELPQMCHKVGYKTSSHP